MKKTICINGVYYTPKKAAIYSNWKSDLFQLYEKPSCEKVRIFNDRKQKLNCIYWLEGNSNTFSIHGNVKDENWSIHNVWITARNNYILD